MITQVIPQAKKLEITFEDDEWPVAVKAFQQNPTEARQLLANWLKGKAAGWEQEDRNKVTSRLHLATQAQLQQIKQVLGL